MVLLIYAATNLFTALQISLNIIFDVEPKPGRGLKAIVRDRAMTFVMVAMIGVFVLASIVLSTDPDQRDTMEHPCPVSRPSGSVSVSPADTESAALGGVIHGDLRAVIQIPARYRNRLEGNAHWRGGHVHGLFAGPAGSGVLSPAGRPLPGPSAQAGSLVIVMLFIYYSSQVMFLGAEFTQIWASRSGKPIKPSKNACWLGAKFAQRHGQPAPVAKNCVRSPQLPAFFRQTEGRVR